MKLGPVTKIDKRNKKTSSKFGDYAMSVNSDIIVIFPICSQFGAIRKLDSVRIACKTCIYLAKNENKIKNSLTQLLHY